MPRLTTRRYLNTHHPPRKWWLHDVRAFACLTPNEQWHLHDFFQLSRQLSETELRAHRKAISRERPSLPHQAGKAVAKFEARAAHQLAQLETLRVAGPSKTKPAERVIGMESVVRPEPDLAKVAIAMAQHLAEQARRDEAA